MPQLEPRHLMTTPQRSIEVVRYDPIWPALFEQEAELIHQAIPKGISAIHHIGSTSVPGLSAKPVIDIMLEVGDVAALDAYAAAMAVIGYSAKGEFGITGRRHYQKGGILRTHHIHAFDQESDGLLRHLAVRDYLRARPSESASYAELKVRLAERFPHDNDGYCEGKHDFVQALEQRALQWNSRCDQDVSGKSTTAE